MCIRDRVTADGEESCFLVFEQPVDNDGSETAPMGRLVQIAYKLTKRLSDEGAISPVVGAKLFVFFQTDKETHTGLIFQAPYRTTCLLYTSDAADERSSVDLGGRRIIKKKNTGSSSGTRRQRNNNTQRNT